MQGTREKTEEGSPLTVDHSPWNVRRSPLTVHRAPGTFWLGKWVLSLSLLLLLPLTGCQVFYLFHAAAGQVRFLYDAVPVEEVLQQDVLSAEQKGRLSLVSSIKQFGEQELGLKASDNYQTINLKVQSPVYTVSAAPKDKLALVTWWFPVVGHLPYLGFFNLDAAFQERDRLQAEDLDTFVARAEAYSTLGWFKDPLSLNLIQGSDLNLVETILHEMTHTTLYVKGQGEFNEGLAQLVGKRGALLFLEKTFGPSHPLTLEAKDSIDDEALFSNFLVSFLSELDALYKDPQLPYVLKLAEREKIFNRNLEAFETIRSRMKTRRFVNFGKGRLNNAYLMSLALYHRHYLLFENVLERKNSIQELLLFFQELSQEKGNLIDRTREWLRLEQAKKHGMTS